MKQVTVATLKLCGGHPALDFTNTVHARGPRFGPDVLRDDDDLLRWSVRIGLLDATEVEGVRRIQVAEGVRRTPAVEGVPRMQAAEGRSVLERAKTLREALHRIFATPGLPAADDLDLLSRTACAAQQSRVLVRVADGYAWRWRDGDPDTVAHRIALAAADLLTSPRVGRVRVCAGENCGWLFLDTSRSGRRVWCSEETCGTRTRVRRWRSKEAGGADGGRTAGPQRQ
ncbi:MAG: hypothetical protein BGO51_10735 [Rhodospirillales bacterium 69-11]|nr:ABATE domain-containing protein [Rhodospirillales bacterium]OJW29518.1 MAG: hypothetical protein BGO51_10735 [Rhodospirillales bacterium 69-11]